MRISDWSSDVCSSDLLVIALQDVEHAEQAGVEGGDGEPVLQVGADVGNAHLQRRKARRGTHVPPDLGAVLVPAGAHHDVAVALVLAEAVQALRQAGALQLLDHREAIALDAGSTPRATRRGSRPAPQ